MPQAEARVADIVVYGQRVRYTYPLIPEDDPGGPVEPDTPEADPGGGELEPACENISGLGDAEKLAYLIKFAMAQAVKSMMAQTTPGEYGTIAYIDNGVLSTTPFTAPAPGQFCATINVGAVPAGAAVVGVLHSHPRMNWTQSPPHILIDFTNPADPGYLLRPSNTRIIGDRLYGDWVSHSYYATQFENPDLLMFIAGAMPGSDDLHLRTYSNADYPYSSGGANSASGDLGRNPIDLEMAPPCSEP